ncbi:hypothetical protein [Streptomyces sp. NPDC057250]|uniref:hypothetical protein n=1 Tax=Streptomyces sp. NPDC057250 TaxID=3346068 RepID=UPI0036280127
MAVRGGPARKYPGNPLGGVIRDVNRRARAMKRRPPPEDGTPAQVEEVPAPRPEPRPAPAPAAGPLAAVVVSGEDGRAGWVFPWPHVAAPVVTAVAVDPEPGTDRETVYAVLEDVAGGRVVVRVWQVGRGGRAGTCRPAGPGVAVHLTAVPLP